MLLQKIGEINPKSVKSKKINNMTIADTLTKELEKALTGDPWFGDNGYAILDRVTFETAYENPPGSVHNIAGIVLHMISWTEEVMDRMNGAVAQLPSSGDWPDPGKPDEQKWQNYVSDFKLVNVNLLGIIQNFPAEEWTDIVAGDRDREIGTGLSFEEQAHGLIQHHIYHFGQIALLTRLNT